MPLFFSSPSSSSNIALPVGTLHSQILSNMTTTLPRLVQKTLTTTGFILTSSISVLPSVARLYGDCFIASVMHSTSFLASVFTTEAVLVLTNQYCLAISLSGNIFLKSGPAWSATANGKLCLKMKVEKRLSAQNGLKSFDCRKES